MSVPILGLVCGVALDLGHNAMSPLRRAFPFEEVAVERRPFVTLRDPIEGFDLATVRAGVDAVRGHSNLYHPTGALPQGHPAYRGEVYLEPSTGTARLGAVRPNWIEIEVRVERPAELVINQTFVRGWRRADRSEEVRAVEGRIATPVRPEDRRVRLVYRPESLTTGMVLSGLSLLLLTAFVVGKRLRSSS